MWCIQSVTLNSQPSDSIWVSDGKPISTVRGPAGASFRLIVAGIGFLDITDIGHVSGGPHYWALDINGSTYWYDGQGSLQINVQSDQSFTVVGDGNSFGGAVKPLPGIDESSIAVIGEMEANGYIPYRGIPDGGKSKQELIDLGLQYFPYSAFSYQLALTVYDWTTADFFRMDLFNLYCYSLVQGKPLASAQIASAIWTANWPPYVPSNADFMNSFMMTPADSLEDVTKQLALVEGDLRAFVSALAEVTQAAKYSLPRTSVLANPQLFSGQVAISNLGESAFPVYFEEYPGNEGPVGIKMELALADALSGFMAPGSELTLKTFLSWTDSLDDAMHYQNGIVLEMNPSGDGQTWGDGITHITQLSDQSNKTEYTASPGAKVRVESYENQVVNGKDVTVIKLTYLGLD